MRSMSGNRPWVPIASILTLVLVLAWIALWYASGPVQAGRDAPERSRGTVHEQPAADSKGDGVARDASPSPAGGGGRTPAGTANTPNATLRIQVNREDGKPATGVVTWTASENHPLTGNALPMFRGEEHDSMRQVSYDDEVTLQVPAGRWIWARVTAAESPFAGWYLRVPPFHGEKVETLLLSLKKRTLHIFVLNPQMTGPAAGQEVGIYAIDMRNPSPPVLLKRVETDDNGYVRVSGLEPGGFFVAGPGAGARDRYPHCTRLMLPRRFGAVEASCTVVAMPETQSVTLRIDAELEAGRRTGMAPKLYLKRKDDGSGQPYPVPAVLQPGGQTCVVRVPPGTYELGALPLGRLVLETNDGFLTVTAGKDPVVDIKARENDAMTSLELRGIPQSEFPVIVHPQRCDDVLDEDPSLFFLGEYRWRLPQQRVPVLGFRCRLVALSRDGTYLADREVQMSRGAVAVAVEMKPACLVQVRWLGPEAVRCEGAIAMTTCGKEQVVTRLRREMVADGAELKPALVGTVVVPRGKLEVECARADGSVAWRREQDGQAQSVLVSVRGE